MSAAAPTVERFHGEVGPILRPHLGRLLTPRDCGGAAATLALGVPVAADNRAYAGWDAREFVRMLDVVAGLPLLWTAVPDVVGDAEATDALWERWAPEVLGRGLRAAYVGQNGYQRIPGQASALFVGGDNTFKLGPEGGRAVRDARERGLPVHVGRVNSVRRIGIVKTLGADTFDGTKYARWSETHLRNGLIAAAAAQPQTSFDMEDAHGWSTA